MLLHRLLQSTLQFNMINPSVREEQMIIFFGEATTSSQKRGYSLLPRYNKVLVGRLFLFLLFCWVFFN